MIQSDERNNSHLVREASIENGAQCHRWIHVSSWMRPEDANHHAHDKAKANWTSQRIRCIAELYATETATEQENCCAKEFGSEYHQTLFNLLCKGLIMEKGGNSKTFFGILWLDLTYLILWFFIIRMSTAIVRSQSETIDVHRDLYIKFSDHFVSSYINSGTNTLDLANRRPMHNCLSTASSVFGPSKCHKSSKSYHWTIMKREFIYSWIRGMARGRGMRTGWTFLGIRGLLLVDKHYQAYLHFITG